MHRTTRFKIQGVSLLVPIWLICFPAAAQLPDQQVIPDQFESCDSLNLSEETVSGSDSLTGEKVSFAEVDVPTYTDEVYAERLRNIGSAISLDYNPEVRRYIDLYVLNRRHQVQRMVGLSKFYYPLFDEIFARYGVPPEMKNLAIIESALNPHAVSKAGATGIWQFMYATAKVYGLTINNYMDERRDIIRSTEGAAQYLSKMYGIYDDWLLAIASYNCGPQNVNRALTRSGGRTFWDIQSYLPRETRGYVPAFIAATYVMNYYELHDLEPEYPKYHWDSIVAISVTDKMSCEQIARFTNLSLDELRFLNPGLRCNVIPALEDPYCIKLPGDKLHSFTSYADSIVHFSANAKTTYYFGSTGDTRVYVVKKGDNLGMIAAKYRVSVSQLKRWNGLSGTTIYPGQRLKIQSPASSAAETASTVSKSAPASKSVAEPKKGPEPAETAAASTGDDVPPPAAKSAPQYVYYKARYGDTLWDIARKHGTTVEDIKDLNGPAKCNYLKAGTVLKISSKG